MWGKPPVRFLEGSGAAIRRCYPTVMDLIRHLPVPQQEKNVTH